LISFARSVSRRWGGTKANFMGMAMVYLICKVRTVCSGVTQNGGLARRKGWGNHLKLQEDIDSFTDIRGAFEELIIGGGGLKDNLRKNVSKH